jgi:CDP-glucose 4,6-dehydratase
MIMLKNNILITGASGFTGSWLARHLLDSGATVTALLIERDEKQAFVLDGLYRRLRKVRGSLVNQKLLARTIADHGIDTVFHLAAIAIEGEAFKSPLETFKVNIQGTWNILDACRQNRDVVRKVIVASSDKVYGDSRALPYRETLPVQGMNAYDVSKSCADLIARAYHRTYGLPVAIARFANIFGGGDMNWIRLIPNTIRSLYNHEPPLVRSPPKGVYKRDFLYIKDQVRAYMALFDGLDRPSVRGEAFNFGMGYCLAVPEIVAKIQRIMHVEGIGPVVQKSNHREILHQQILAEKARQQLGWAPKYSIDQGLEETVEWYRSYLEATMRKQGAMNDGGKTPRVRGTTLAEK